MKKIETAFYHEFALGNYEYLKVHTTPKSVFNWFKNRIRYRTHHSQAPQLTDCKCFNSTWNEDAVCYVCDDCGRKTYPDPPTNQLTEEKVRDAIIKTLTKSAIDFSRDGSWIVYHIADKSINYIAKEIVALTGK